MRRYTGTALIADGQPDQSGMSHDIESVTVPDDEVVVTWNYDKTKPLGTARLRKEGDRVVVDATIDPEKLAACLVPAVGGVIHKGVYSIDHLGISDNNVDARIEPLEEVD